jgi:alpha-D-ribose 1-methylphosphonate 5-triphosphate synthase subunit PhnL
MKAENPALLEVENLHKQFELHLLDGRVIEPFKRISFRAWSGSLMLISGKSGAGKTTVLKCIYRTYLTNSGYIWYNSSEFGRIDLATSSEALVLRLRERELGYCSQFLKVLPRVPALERSPTMRRPMVSPVRH